MCMYVCMNVCMYMYTFKCMYIRIRKYIYNDAILVQKILILVSVCSLPKYFSFTSKIQFSFYLSSLILSVHLKFYFTDNFSSSSILVSIHLSVSLCTQ